MICTALAKFLFCISESKIVRHLKYDKFSGIAVKFIFDNKNQQKDLMRFIAKNS
jgi:hypothetical protein